MVSEPFAALRDPRPGGADVVEFPSRAADSHTGDDGFPVRASTESYHVLAFRARPGADGAVADPLGAVLAAFESRCGAGVLPVVGASAGTVLVPVASATAEELDALVAEAGAATRTELVVAAVCAEVTEIRGAHDRAHELLDLAEWLDRGPGVHRFRDLALEYQLTRPGRARDLLVAILAPVGAEQRTTLERYVRVNGDPAATARGLNLPRAAVEADLDEIARRTGLQPRISADLWRLYAALVARTGAEHDDEPPPRPRRAGRGANSRPGHAG